MNAAAELERVLHGCRTHGDDTALLTRTCLHEKRVVYSCTRLEGTPSD